MMFEEYIPYVIVGGIGGAVRNLIWLFEKPTDETQKFSVKKTIRNVIIGALVGGFVGMPTKDLMVTFFCGNSAELILQKSGSIIESKILK